MDKKLIKQVVDPRFLLVVLLLTAVILNLPVLGESPGPWGDDAGHLDEPTEAQCDNPSRMVKEPIAVSLAALGWTNIMTENFEGGWPSAGWTAADNDGATNGEYYWGPTSCYDYGASGDHDAVPHVAGASATYTCWQPYPANLRAWMIYGPFDLSNATDAELLFSLDLDSEQGHDYLKYMASTNGTNFNGYQTSGDTGGWVTKNFDLTSVPTLGNLCGQSQVWIAIVFNSDAGGDGHGPWVDDIILRASTGAPPDTKVFITCEDNENNAHTHTADGDMYPANNDCIYNNNYKDLCPDLRNPLAPIEFNIVIPALPSFSVAELNLTVWDVDEQGDPDNPTRPREEDEVYLNGHYVGLLTGADQTWSTSHFNVNPAWVQQGRNLVEVRIDVHNGCWCVAIDCGQLVLDGGGGTASIRSWAPLRDCWWPGSTQAVQVEVDTSLSSQEVRVEINVLDANNVNLIGTSQTKTIHGTQNDAFVFNLNVPAGAQPGNYTVQVIVYDTQTGYQQDYDEKTVRIDPTCETVTPVITDTPTRTRTPTPTRTRTPTPTRTRTPTPTRTSTPTPTRTRTPTPTSTPTRTNTPTPTVTPTITSALSQNRP